MTYANDTDYADALRVVWSYAGGFQESQLGLLFQLTETAKAVGGRAAEVCLLVARETRRTAGLA